jgi:hypothetical protein
MHAALLKLCLDEAVKVSTPIAFTALEVSCLPSVGRFRRDIAGSVMKPLRDFLERTGGRTYLTINAYPFFPHLKQPDKIPLDYALGAGKQPLRRRIPFWCSWLLCL